MGENRISDDNPLKETIEDRIERELRNNFNILHLIDQRLEDIYNSVEANTANIEILQEAIEKFAVVPTHPIDLIYGHNDKKLWVNKRFYIPFSGREADVLALMFYKKSGKPKNVKFQCSEVAEDLTDSATGIRPTPKAIHSAATRIQAKLNGRLNTKDLLSVSTKEFYFSLKK